MPFVPYLRTPVHLSIAREDFYMSGTLSCKHHKHTFFCECTLWNIIIKKIDFARNRWTWCTTDLSASQLQLAYTFTTLKKTNRSWETSTKLTFNCIWFVTAGCTRIFYIADRNSDGYINEVHTMFQIGNCVR